MKTQFVGGKTQIVDLLPSSPKRRENNMDTRPNKETEMTCKRCGTGNINKPSVVRMDIAYCPICGNDIVKQEADDGTEGK